MKKILILLSAVILVLNAFAADDYGCTAEWQSITNPGSPIEFWGDDYQPCLRYEWNLMFPDEWSYVEFDYTIDLNPIGAIDVVLIYMIDELGQEREILNYSNQPISEKITLPIYSPSARVVFISEYGNSEELYQGFKLYYRQGSSISNDQVFYSNVGIGIQPQERLHVNGAIRGDGESGSLRIRTTAGTTEIGAADSVYSHFYTDRSAYFFNKPVYLSDGTLAAYSNNSLKFQTNDTNRMVINSEGDIELFGNIYLNGAINGADRYNQSTRIQSQYGYADIGAVNAGYFHFYTDRPGYYFNKALTVNGGTFRAASNNDLYLNTFDRTRLTILYQNGYVGIGTKSPEYKLDVNGTIRADGIIADGTIRADSIIADGTIRVDGLVVDGTIQAEEIIVKTTGADFVFAEDYQLRPLSEVKTFIQENKHLPEIKSAKEMQENGVGINELQTQLLQKIEELTLYILQQEERIKALEMELNK